MRKLWQAALFLSITCFIGALSVQGLAARQPSADDFRHYGFVSKDEMKRYFTIAETKITEEQLPQELYDIVVLPPDFGRGVNALPTPTPPPPPGGGTVLLPGITPSPNPSVSPMPSPSPGTTPAITPYPTPWPTPMPTIPNTIPPGTSTGNPAIDVILNPGLVDSWITIGAKLWNIIAAGRPVANVSYQRVSILPGANVDWMQMSNWKGPATRTYRVKKVNGFGMTVVENTYTLVYNYGGQINGVGAFIANATIIPTAVNVMYGFQLDAEAQVGQPVNVGTKENPIAAMELQVRYRVKTLMSDSQGTDAFFLRGDGQMEQINETVSSRIK